VLGIESGIRCCFGPVISDGKNSGSEVNFPDSISKSLTRKFWVKII